MGEKVVPEVAASDVFAGVEFGGTKCICKARVKLAQSLGGYSTGAAIATRTDDYLVPAALGDMAGPIRRDRACPVCRPGLVPR
jgi:hypothetical protein